MSQKWQNEFNSLLLTLQLSPKGLFAFQSLQSGYINYIQSKHKGSEPLSDLFMISISDGFHKSTPIPFYVIIVPVNDEIPVLQLKNITVR